MTDDLALVILLLTHIPEGDLESGSIHSDRCISPSLSIVYSYYYILWLIYVVSCYVISEWRSHSSHYFLVHNSSKCKPTKHPNQHRIIVCNKNNNKLVFNQSLENTCIVLVGISDL